jgi:mevalonate kinase
MQTETTEIFYSKIMLFGEYTIIKGSRGLTIPYAHFNGQLAFPNRDSYTDMAFAQRSNQQLYEFWYFLQSLYNNNTLGFSFDTEQFKEDLDNGLYFESTIPEGYGLGSSGALVAALYKKYAADQTRSDINMSAPLIRNLKEQLAQLESWFHGTSSGIDPLICLIKHPLLLKDLNHIEPVELPRYDDHGSDAIFLINSGKPGKTAPLVKGFIEKYNNDTAFFNLVNQQLTPVTNACITTLANNQKDDFYKHLKALSALQMKHLHNMVPPGIKALWKNGLTTGDYYLKLCGSGGGGFMLGFTRDYPKTKQIIYELKMETIPVYQDLKEK